MPSARTQRTLLVPLGGGTTYADVVRSLSPLLWLRLRETSGTDVANSGSVSVTSTFSPGVSGAVGQTGFFGANEAFSWDKQSTALDVGSNATLQNAGVHTFAFLCRAADAGEGNFGYFFDYAGAPSLGNFMRFNGNLGLISAFNDFSTGDATTTTAASNGLSANTWTWVFKTLSSDRTNRIYRGLSSAVTEYSYGTQTAGTGSYVVPSGALTIGNRAAGDVTWNGLFDEVLLFDFVLTNAQMTQIVTASGV